MPTTALPFGMGLDRYTGVMQVDPASMMDMRNLRPLVGKLQARAGIVKQASLPDQGGESCTAVTLLQPVRSQSEGIAVGYYDGSREVHVFRVGGDGTNPVHIGKWFDLADGAASPPYFHSAETFGKAFLAHDEAKQVHRAPTQVYDAALRTLADLVEDPTAETKVPIRFRGVEAWSDYLMGWGYGGFGDPDIRPDIVRASKPAEPDTFLPEHYFIVGDRGSPVTAVRQAGSALVALKPTDSYRILGTSRLNFGIMPFYSLFGSLSGRLAISVEGTLFAWGFEGPWSVTGSTGATDLEQPLSLETGFPVDLPPASPTRDAFAVYIPGDRVVEFHFGARIYTLSLADGGLRWSFRTRLGARAAAGTLMYSIAFDDALAADSATPPDGGPTIESLVSAAGMATLTWNNAGQDANEALEIWVGRLTFTTGTGKFRRDYTVADPNYERQLPDQSVTAAPSQTAMVPVPELGETYRVAIRYRRGNRYSSDYESDDPADWPPGAQMDVRSLPAAPVIDSATFVRTSATTVAMRVAFTPAAGHEEYTHVLYRDGQEKEDEVATAAGGVHTFEDDTAPVGVNVVYKAICRTHGVDSPMSEPSVQKVRPAEPQGVTLREHTGIKRCNPGQRKWLLDWDTAGFGFRYEIREEETKVSDLYSFTAVILCGSAKPMFEVRQYMEAFGVRDYSDWVLADPPRED